MELDLSYADNIEIDTTDNGRWYYIDGIAYPSITTILAATSTNNIWLQAWKERVGEGVANQIRQEAADRGTLVHNYLEKFWCKENIWNDLLQETSDIQKMTNALITKTQEHFGNLWAIEIPVYHSELGYAGRLDKLGIYKDIPCIIDYKTSKKKKNIKQIKDYYVQVTAYALAVNKLFNLNIKNFAILIAVENGEVQEFIGSTLPYINDLKYRLNQYKKGL